MHAISFQLKRAHLATTAYAARAVEEVEGMTPARYDVLAFMRERSLQHHQPKLWGLGFTAQGAIVGALGLHPSTVSKMLKRMEEMGWIVRQRDEFGRDKRRKTVDFTPLGFRKACQAMRRVDRQRLFLRPFERITRQLRPGDHVLHGLQQVWGTIDGIGRFFGDRSFFTYRRGFPLGPRPQFAADVPARERRRFIRPCEDVEVCHPNDSAHEMFDVLTNAARTMMDRRGMRSGQWRPPRPRTEAQRARLRRRLERAVRNGASSSLLAEWDQREERRLREEKVHAERMTSNPHNQDDIAAWEDDDPAESIFVGEAAPGPAVPTPSSSHVPAARASASAPTDVPAPAQAPARAPLPEPARARGFACEPPRAASPVPPKVESFEEWLALQWLLLEPRAMPGRASEQTESSEPRPPDDPLDP